MEKMTAGQAKDWLEPRRMARYSRLGRPGPAFWDPAGLAPMGATIHRALLHRAEMGPRVPSDMWWLVDAPALTEASGITANQVLAFTGRELGWCRWGCELGFYGKFPLAAVLYYQGQFADSRTPRTDGLEEAGFSAIMRFKGPHLSETRLLVVHVSRAGVRCGEHLNGEMVQLLHDVEAGAVRLQDWGELHHGDLIDAAEEACKCLRDLARHLQGVLRT